MKWTARFVEDKKGGPRRIPFRLDHFLVSNGDQVFVVQDRSNGFHITYKRTGYAYRATIFKFSGEPTVNNLAYIEAALQSPLYEKWESTYQKAIKHVKAWGGKPESKAFYELLPQAAKELIFFEHLRRVVRTVNLSKEELDGFWDKICVEQVMNA
jgi:hypothetical protein